jgi:Fe2+ transport system protein FeoA
VSGEPERIDSPTAKAEPTACDAHCCPHPGERTSPGGGGFPLCLGRCGEALKVVRIRGGKVAARRLADLGLQPGAEIKIAGNLGGPMIVEVKGARISLGRGIASKVMVE